MRAALRGDIIGLNFPTLCNGLFVRMYNYLKYIKLYWKLRWFKAWLNPKSVSILMISRCNQSYLGYGEPAAHFVFFAAMFRRLNELFLQSVTTFLDNMFNWIYIRILIIKSANVEALKTGKCTPHSPHYRHTFNMEIWSQVLPCTWYDVTFCSFRFSDFYFWFS